MLTITDISEECRELGRREPSLSDEELGKRFAKLIVGNKIHDDDAFEVAAEAYKEGKESRKEVPHDIS